MANISENKFLCGGNSGGKETIAVETNRILDSCRDRDCFENVKVYLTDAGNEIIERTNSVRTTSAKISWTYIGIDPIQFNHGFYSLTIRFFVKLSFEGCIGACSHEFEGIAVLEKKVILYGGESNVSVFKSSAEDSFCKMPEPSQGKKSVPEAVVEVVDPIVLSANVVEKRNCIPWCCCCPEEIPDGVNCCINGGIGDCEKGERYLVVTIGVFSIIRIVRPGQYLISASEYCIPDKECVTADEDNPCRLFNSMAFPISDFCPPNLETSEGRCGNDKRCGC